MSIKKSLLHIPEQKSDMFYQKELYLSSSVNLNNLQKILSPNDYNHYTSLCQVERKGLKKAIKDLEALIKKYPSCYEVHNLLTYSYIRKRRIKKADQSIFNSYQSNPKHLLARINYADFLLRKKRVKDFEKLFQNTFDLRNLYPERQVFSVQEFIGFMTNLGFYYLIKKNENLAERYHYLASRIAPNDSKVRCLRKKLYHKPWYKRLYFKIKNIPLSS